MTMICVPLMVEEHAEAIRDATLAAEHGADIVEFRVDVYFEDQVDSTDLLQDRIDRILELVKDSPLPCIVTCRPHWEGGEYHGDDDERIALYEALGTSDHPPAYIDVELATFNRSANIRQKIKLAVDHPEQERSVSTRLILSSHDFNGRPSDLTRRVLEMQSEPACAVVKIAYRARSIRDNLELFDLLSESPKPMIALCMGEFGLMSRVLAPKFGGLLTFATLRDESSTAPGQPTIGELLDLYRFRKIKRSTKVYGIIGWPVTQSMSPLVHNAGFEAIDWDGVYVPMPVEGSYESFKATLLALIDSTLEFTGASVTIPHKESLGRFSLEFSASRSPNDTLLVAGDGGVPQNTLEIDGKAGDVPLAETESTDQSAIHELIAECVPSDTRSFAIVGAGGAADAAARAAMDLRAEIHIFNRSPERAEKLIEQIAAPELAHAHTLDELASVRCDLYINCTPVGMTGGPDPDGLSIPIPEMHNLSPDTVFFDTVYNPIETPMLKAARERGYRTIDGVQMFVKQAEAQFEIWTSKKAPADLFDRLVREKLSS
jgi:3-dehydroquinate dehydratase/shikimate dehydrogenase